MFKQLWEDIFSPYSSFGDRCLGLIICFAGVAIPCLLAFMVFVLVDTAGVEPTNSATTVVETKRVQPPYTTFIFVGKVIVPQYHAATYWLGFKLEGSPVATSVKKPFFDSVVVGSNIKVDYGFGRLSHEYEPTRITLVDN